MVAEKKAKTQAFDPEKALKDCSRVEVEAYLVHLQSKDFEDLKLYAEAQGINLKEIVQKYAKLLGVKTNDVAKKPTDKNASNTVKSGEPKSPPKYFNPDNSEDKWAGRGAKPPAWVNAIVAKEKLSNSAYNLKAFKSDSRYMRVKPADETK